MGVELRPVNAGEAHLASHRHPAPTAHPGAVHHDGVETGEGTDTPLPGHAGRRAHHGNRADYVRHVRSIRMPALPLAHEIHHGTAEFARTVVGRPEYFVG